MDTIHPLPNREQAPYLLLFDPLDGSSNIDVNTSIGTIFSILKNPGTALNEQSFLQPGTQQVAAGYAVYGPQTMLVFSLEIGRASCREREEPRWAEVLSEERAG